MTIFAIRKQMLENLAAQQQFVQEGTQEAVQRSACLQGEMLALIGLAILAIASPLEISLQDDLGPGQDHDHGDEHP